MQSKNAMTTLNAKDIKTLSEGGESYYSTIINLTAAAGRNTTNVLLGMLTSKLSGHYPLLPEKVEIIDERGKVVRVKWTQPQRCDLNKELKNSFAELEKLKREGKISDWQQVSN